MNKNVKILISEFMDDEAVDTLKAKFDVQYLPQLVDDKAGLLKQVEDIDAIIVRNRTMVDQQLINNAKKLKVVGRLGVGLDNIDVEYCKNKQIEVIPATGVNALSVAEYAVATAVMLLRGVYLESQKVIAGKWPRAKLSQGREARGKTFALCGFGSIGQITAELAKNFGFKIIAHDPLLPADSPAWKKFAIQNTAFDELIALADVISLHLPLLPATKNIINESKIKQMKAGAILINTARGGTVDEKALIDNLKNGHLGGAALDVFANEPLSGENDFNDCPNLILTPHIAGVSKESNIRVSSFIAEKVTEFFKN